MAIQYETEIVHRDGDQHFISGITSCVKWLLISNVLIFLVLSLGDNFKLLNEQWFFEIFGQVNKSIISRFMIWQLATCLFLHGGIRHIFGNMIYLWIFGTMLEREWGSRRFIIYYLVCGIGANLVELAIQPFSEIPGIGASGAIFGLLGACGLLFPNRDVYILMVKIKLKYVVAVFAAIELYLCIMGTADGIGHWVHISGLVIGILFIKAKGLRMSRQALVSGGKPQGSRFDNIEL